MAAVVSEAIKGLRGLCPSLSSHKNYFYLRSLQKIIKKYKVKVKEYSVEGMIPLTNGREIQ